MYDRQGLVRGVGSIVKLMYEKSDDVSLYV